MLAFFFPSPWNVWIHRLYGAQIGPYVTIHPGVLLLVDHLEIGQESKMRLGTFINCSGLTVGRKCLFGYFLIVKGLSELKTGDACTIGPKTMINCDMPVTLGYYCGIGPGCTLFTHGSFLPVTEGYKTHFGPITLKDKSWINMNSTVGPSVTIGSGSIAMPGSILLENVERGKIVAGDPAKFRVLPQFKNFKIKNDLEAFARSVLDEYRDWANQYNSASFVIEDDDLVLKQPDKRVVINKKGYIQLLTRPNDKAVGMFFNLHDLTTDSLRNPDKRAIDEYLRLYYGLIFLPVED
jgi:acetyltransferase-like isoleucine patch superfamily enzyme